MLEATDDVWSSPLLQLYPHWLLQGLVQLLCLPKQPFHCFQLGMHRVHGLCGDSHVLPYLLSYVWARCWDGLYWHHLCKSDRQVVQPAVTVPMPGATLAAPSFGMRGSYNDYLSMPAGNMTSAYGRGYTPTGTFRYDSRVGAGGSNRHYWGLLSLQDGRTSCKLRMQYSYGGCRRVDNVG